EGPGISWGGWRGCSRSFIYKWRRFSLRAPLCANGEVRPVAPEPPAIVELIGVSRTYGSRLAVDQVDLALRPGKLTFLVGPSGAGKTTLLKLINREIRPTSGEVWVAVVAAHRLKATRVATLRRRVGAGFPGYQP